MWNGIDYLGFFITFGGGFIIGVFVGIMIFAAMHEQDREEGNDE